MFSEEFKTRMKEEQGFTDEQIEFIGNEVFREIFFHNGYKLKCGSPVKVYRQSTSQGMEYYKVQLYGKNQDGSTKTCYKNVEFLKCEKPKGEQNKIIIRRFFEDFFISEKDKYNPKFTLKIMDWEYVNEETQERFEDNTALNEYSTVISDDDLPF